MGHAQSSLSSGEKKAAIVGSVLLFVLVAFGVVSAATESTTSTSPALPPPIAVPPMSTTELENQKRQIKDSLDYAKRLRDELGRIKKDLPEIDISASLEQVSKYESCLNAVQPGMSDFWGALSPCNDYSRIVEDDLNDRLRPIQNCTNTRNDIQKNRKRERKDIERQIKDIIRQDKTADVSGLQNLLGQIDAELVKADQFGKCSGADDRDGIDDVRRNLDDLFRDFYDLSREIRDKANLAQCRTDNKKDFDKNLKRQCEKEYTREMKQLEKDFNKAEKAGQLTEEDRANFTAAKDNFTAICVTQMGVMEQALNADDCDAFNDARNEFHSLNQDFWTLVQAAREGFDIKQRLKDIERDWKRWRIDIANLHKEYERAVKRSGITDAELESLLKQIDEKFVEAQEAAKTDPSSWWNEYQTTINEFMQAFWERHQEVFQKAENIKNTERWLKDLERDLKFREKDLKRMKNQKEFDDPSVYETLEGILSRMRNVVAKARELLLSDPEAANEILQEFDELRFEWDETTRFVWENNDFKFKLEEALRIIEYIKKELERLADEGKLSRDEAGQCRSFVDKVEAGAKILNPGDDVEEYFNAFEAEAHSACPTFDKLIGEGAPPPDQEYYQDFLEENVQGLDHDFAAEVLTKVSEDVVAKIMQRLLTDPSIVEAFLKAAGSQKDVAANTLEAVTIYNESEQKDILAKKAEILELNKQLEGLQVQLKAAKEQLVAIQNELESYNFYGVAADNIRDQMERLIAEIQSATDDKTKQRLIAELNEKKNEAISLSKDAKWKDKKIPFLDTDDNFWGTKHIAKAARCEFARGKGDGSNFDSEGDVRVAEILTMAFRASRDSEPSGNSNLCDGKFKGHWGNKFIRWAEDKGLSIASACTDVDRPALRWEIAQVLGELAADGKLPASSEACFSDVKASDKSPNAAVCYAQAKGFMKGTDGKSNAYSRVNRAEAATMVVSVGERLLGFQCGVAEKEKAPPRRSGDEDEDDEDFEEDEDEDRR